MERRDRALVAFLFLTGLRDAAAISIRIKHIDLGARLVIQNASEVHTKFGKNMKTSFFPVGDDIESIVTSWVTERCATGAGPESPLFPSGQTIFNGETRRHEEKAWTTTAPVRKIFKQACLAADLPYFNPRAVRKTLMRLALTSCKTAEELQAWSQNLGHEQLQTSMVSYGKLDSSRQHELLQNVHPCGSAADEAELLEQYRQLSPELQSAVRTLLAARAG